MTEERMRHRATSADGTPIVGRTHGSGPPLVFVHGVLCDGEYFVRLAPYLADRFTCHLMSTRGRGESGASDDLSSARRTEDVTAYVESLGEPVALFGHSMGGRTVLEVAARSEAVAAVAVYEPALPEVLGDDGMPDLAAAFGRMAGLASEGRPEDAAGAFFEAFIAQDELVAAREAGLLEMAARYVPLDLRGTQQDRGAARTPIDEALGRLAGPLLVLKGSASSAWFQQGSRKAAGGAPRSEERVLDGCGHFAPYLEPAPIAEELRRFFEGRRRSS